MDDGDRDTAFACSAGTARTMGVYGCIVGETIVDDVRQIVDVETSGSYIGGHKYADNTIAELAHHYVALLLREVTVKRVGIVAVGNQFVSDFLSVAACAAEHDSIDVWIVVGDAFKGEIFVARVHHIIYMCDIGCALIAHTHHDFLWRMHIALGYSAHFGRHGRREKQHLAFVRKVRQNVID